MTGRLVVADPDNARIHKFKDLGDEGEFVKNWGHEDSLSLSIGGGAATDLAEHYETQAAQKFRGEIDGVEATVQTEIGTAFDPGAVDSFSATIAYGEPVKTEYTATFTETGNDTNEFTAEIEVVEGGGGGGTQLCLEGYAVSTASGPGTFTPIVLRVQVPDELAAEHDFIDQQGMCVFRGQGIRNDAGVWWNFGAYSFSEKLYYCERVDVTGKKQRVFLVLDDEVDWQIEEDEDNGFQRMSDIAGIEGGRFTARLWNRKADEDDGGIQKDAQGNEMPDEKYLHTYTMTVVKIEIDFTDNMRVDGDVRFVYPCHHDCHNRNLLRYRIEGVTADQVEWIRIRVKDPSDETDFEQDATLATGWQEVFQGITNAGHDADNASNTAGGRWKYIDPTATGGATFEAEVELRLKNGLSCFDRKTFEARRRNVAIIDKGFCPRFFPLNWGTDCAWAPDEMGSVLILTYAAAEGDVDYDFMDAYENLTPRGALISWNEGRFLEYPAGETDGPDGNDLFGAVRLGDAADDHAGFSGFGEAGTGFPGFPPLDLAPVVRSHRVSVDLRHCFSAHRSGVDGAGRPNDSGDSVAMTLSNVINSNVSSGTVIGYWGPHVTMAGVPESLDEIPGDDEHGVSAGVADNDPDDNGSCQNDDPGADDGHTNAEMTVTFP